MSQGNRSKLSRRERRARERMVAKEAKRQGKVAEERDLQSGSVAGFRKSVFQQFRQDALPLLAFLVAIFVFYFPALSGEFIWDDVIFSEDKTIHDWSGLWSIWFAPREIAKEAHYWPLTYTTFWLQHKLFGLNPLGYHITSCILYFVNIVLIWRLLLKLEVPGAWAISMIFAVHPLHVESVAWLIEQKTLLSALFYLGAIHAWLRFRESSNPKTYALALGLYALGLLSKAIVVTLPAVLLVLLWWKQKRISAQDLMRLIPFFIVGFAIALLDYLLYIFRGEQFDVAYSFLERILIASQAVWFYLGKLLWPTNLMVIYPHWDVAVENLLNWLFVATTVGGLILLWACRHRIGKGPLAGVAFFIISLLPILGFVDHKYMEFSFVADRYQYLAGLGVMTVLIGVAIHAMPPRITSFRPVVMGVLAVLVIGLGSLTWRQATIYQDELTFFSHIVAHNPAAYDAHYNLGVALNQAGRIREAYEANLKAIALRPNEPKPYSNNAIVLMQMQRYDEAEESLKRALELGPRYDAAWQNYGELHLKQQRYEEAVAAFQRAIDLDTDSVLAYGGIADSYHRLGHHAKAMEWIDRAQALNPAPFVQEKLSQLSVQVLLALGKTEEAERHLLQAEQNGDSHREVWKLLELHQMSTKQGDTDKARTYLQRILKIAGGNPETLRIAATTLQKREQFAEAIVIYKKILAIEPDSHMAYAGMGDALFRLERYEEAIESLKRSIELHSIPPSATDRLILLGRASSELGRSEEAVQYHERAVELDPQNASALEHLAIVRYQEKHYEDALRLYTAARDNRPDDARLHFGMGSMLYNLGRLKEAADSYEAALSLDPSMEDARHNLEQLKQMTEEQE